MLAAVVTGGLLALPATVAHATSAGPTIQSVGVKLVTPSTMGTDGSFQVQVVGKATSASPICAYQIERYGSASGWTYVGQFSGSKLTYATSLVPSGGSYEYAMNVEDCNSNWSGWNYSLSTMPTALDDNVFTYSGSWQRQYETGPFGGSEMVGQTGAQATATMSFYNIGLVSATQSSGFGSFKVSVDGVLQGKAISTKSSGATHYRQILFRAGSGVYGTHTITVQVVSGKVHLDAITVLASGTHVPTWAVQPTPNPPNGTARGDILTGVSCTSASACTAAGWFFTGSAGQMTVAETWDGTAWAIHPTSNPGGALDSELSGVSCASATACFAVGQYSSAPGYLAALVEVWDGTNWAVQPAPIPAGSQSESLSGVSCTSATACTAVGHYFNSASRDAPLAEIWNGMVWVVQPTPNPPGYGSFLLSVSCTSTTSCTAGGYTNNIDGSIVTLVETWDGTTWTIRPAPNPVGATRSYLFGVSCTSTAACAAVGYYYKHATGLMPLAEAWDGTAWTIQPTSIPGGGQGSTLFGVSCTSAATCTAVGNSSAVSGGTLEVAWDGTTWTVQPTAIPDSGGPLLGVSCTSTAACTAVGASNGTLAEWYS